MFSLEHESMINKTSHRYVLVAIRNVVDHTPWFIWAIIDFILDICMFWIRKAYEIYTRKDPLREYEENIKNAKTYNEWKKIARKIDRFTHMDIWRQNLVSKLYDYVLINERLKQLREARLDNNDEMIISLLRSGLIRNFGGIARKRLYIKSYLGTKYQIEEYIDEVLDCLAYLSSSITSRNRKNKDEYISNTRQLKLEFFNDVKQSFGSTALLLQGGSLFGLCHLGVIRALYFKRLLPKIIGGSAVGAAVASLVCSLDDEELTQMLWSVVDTMGDIDAYNHDVDQRFGNVIENVVGKGYSQDVLIFLEFVRDTVGDITFEEAYSKTGRILNIVVHPSHSCIPSLLNHITAPNVVIWTAIYASTGTGVLSDDVQLCIKDLDNCIVPKFPEINIKFLKPEEVSYSQQYFVGKQRNDSTQGIRNFRFEKGSPYARLTELFNVNHFIISLARPYLAPLISRDLEHIPHSKLTYKDQLNKKRSGDVHVVQHKKKEDDIYYDRTRLSLNGIEKKADTMGQSFFTKVKTLTGMEIQHRIEVMNKLGLLSNLIKRICIDEKPSTPQSLTSIREVVLVPELTFLLKDFGKVFDIHKTMENIPYWVLVGERSVWPLFPLLRVRCSIEFTLDDFCSIQRTKTK
ncbi:Piso0_000172 [Millerozyma farinosa CBS 7064]|uniref:Piso0_000172 protein n=1 Tax=Pichia sorbitophila (strain ATCC MYA-4447 / BCRC 22081 / CBS 7064 / NBRC 10061 / NRRL Y-12695) TaxID=559304 RepID=G8YUQ3_PICSO|nr:Piso0_000172 [Millerozyma farinosa CBS 7064]